MPSVITTLVDDLQPYRNNARTHSARQIKAIARSIERFGFLNPVLIDKENRIIAGHGRVQAASFLGLKTVPSLRIDHLSDAEKRAYVLADNRLAERAGWDKEILAIELQYLIDVEFDAVLSGFEMAEIDIVLDDAAEARGSEGKDDLIPPPRAGRTVTQVGDFWRLGNHRLFCGDARDPSAYEFLLACQKANLVITDPPYNVKIDGNVCGLGQIRHQNFAMACGEMSAAEYAGFLKGTFKLLAQHSIDGSIHQIFMDWRHMDEMLAAGRSAYSELLNLCVWNKSNAGMGSFYRSKHELVFVWKNGVAPHVNNVELGRFGRSRSNVWDYAGVNTFKSGRLDELAMHPTVKPVALVVDAIKDCSGRGGIVLDPFVGSGTTIVAAEKCGRKAAAIEIDPRYCDVAIARWQTYTGKKAILHSSGQTFEEAESSRNSATFEQLEDRPTVPGRRRKAAP